MTDRRSLAVDETKKLFRMYPLSKKDNPPKMTFVNISGIFDNTIHRMDYGYWEELNATIQAEPLEGLDPETRGLLAAIGMKKGKEFKPDDRMKKILTDAAKIGSVTARALTARPFDQRHYLYPGERVWTNPFIQGRYDFLLGGERLLDSRIYMHFYATGITPAMAVKNVGKGSQYAIAYLDKDGKALDGSKTYKINLPKDVPAKDFWSFTLYDNQSRGMLQTDQRFPGVDSNKRRTQAERRWFLRRLLRSEGTRRVRRTTGSRPTQARGGTPSSASMVRWSPSTTRPGSRAIPSWSGSRRGSTAPTDRFCGIRCAVSFLPSGSGDLAAAGNWCAASCISRKGNHIQQKETPPDGGFEFLTYRMKR